MTKDEFIKACNERMADPKFRVKAKTRRNVFGSMKAIRQLARCRAMREALKGKRDAESKLQ